MCSPRCRTGPMIRASQCKVNDRNRLRDGFVSGREWLCGHFKHWEGRRRTGDRLAFLDSDAKLVQTWITYVKTLSFFFVPSFVWVVLAGASVPWVAMIIEWRDDLKTWELRPSIYASNFQISSSILKKTCSFSGVFRVVKLGQTAARTFILRDALVFQIPTSKVHAITVSIFVFIANRHDRFVTGHYLIHINDVRSLLGHCASCSKTIFSERQDRMSRNLSKPTISYQQIRCRYGQQCSLHIALCRSLYLLIILYIYLHVMLRKLYLTDLFQGSSTSIPWSAQWLSQQPQQQGTLQYPIHSSHSSVSNPFFQELESWSSKSTPFQRTRLRLMHHHHTIP